MWGSESADVRRQPSRRLNAANDIDSKDSDDEFHHYNDSGPHEYDDDQFYQHNYSRRDEYDDEHLDEHDDLRPYNLNDLQPYNLNNNEHSRRSLP